jgi:hypothetical protein
MSLLVAELPLRQRAGEVDGATAGLVVGERLEVLVVDQGIAADEVVEGLALELVLVEAAALEEREGVGRELEALEADRAVLTEQVLDLGHVLLDALGAALLLRGVGGVLALVAEVLGHRCHEVGVHLRSGLLRRGELHPLLGGERLLGLGAVPGLTLQALVVLLLPLRHVVVHLGGGRRLVLAGALSLRGLGHERATQRHVRLPLGVPEATPLERGQLHQGTVADPDARGHASEGVSNGARTVLLRLRQPTRRGCGLAPVGPVADQLCHWYSFLR